MKNQKTHPLEDLYLEGVRSIMRRINALEPLKDPTALPELQSQLQTLTNLVQSNRLLRHHLVLVQVTLLFIQN